MLTLTDSAVQRFKEFLEQENLPDHGIRIFSAYGGRGTSLAMDIADSAQDGDAILEKDGLKVFLEKEANKLLSDATLGFSDEKGFVIKGMPKSACCN